MPVEATVPSHSLSQDAPTSPRRRVGATVPSCSLSQDASTSPKEQVKLYSKVVGPIGATVPSYSLSQGVPTSPSRRAKAHTTVDRRSERRYPAIASPRTHKLAVGVKHSSHYSLECPEAPQLLSCLLCFPHDLKPIIKLIQCRAQGLKEETCWPCMPTSVRVRNAVKDWPVQGSYKVMWRVGVNRQSLLHTVLTLLQLPSIVKTQSFHITRMHEAVGGLG